jgi:outer membrane protein assembly factor BamB
VSEAFQREVFGGDWRRPGSGRAPWLDVMGPLYYSFDWGGVHFVAYDGEGLRRYGADYPQDRWLAADLAAVAPGTPVVVCTHFPETQEFFRTRFSGVRLVASVSGHWHGTRVWHDGDATHWTSSTTGFGGIDFTPRGFRVVEVDASGARSWWETMEAPSPARPRVTGAAAVVEGRVIVAMEDGDARGSVSALGGWTYDLPVAARGGVSSDGARVYAMDLGARLLALDAKAGARLWSHELGDPSVRWNLGVPVPVDGLIYAGSAMSVHAFDAHDGSELWRTDLAPADWAASWGGVTADGDTVVIGATNDHLHLAALDAGSGAVRWRQGSRDIAGVSATPVIADDVVLAARAPGWLAAYALSDGALTWEAALDDAWPVALVTIDDVAIVRSATGVVTAHDLRDGHVRWTCSLGAGVRAGRPYSRTPGGARFPLVIIEQRLWTATFDSVVEIDVSSGSIVSQTAIGDEVATIVADGSTVLVVTPDARVRRAVQD